MAPARERPWYNRPRYVSPGAAAPVAATPRAGVLAPLTDAAVHEAAARLFETPGTVQPILLDDAEDVISPPLVVGGSRRAQAMARGERREAVAPYSRRRPPPASPGGTEPAGVRVTSAFLERRELLDELIADLEAIVRRTDPAISPASPLPPPVSQTANKGASTAPAREPDDTSLKAAVTVMSLREVMEENPTFMADNIDVLRAHFKSAQDVANGTTRRVPLTKVTVVLRTHMRRPTNGAVRRLQIQEYLTPGAPDKNYAIWTYDRFMGESELNRSIFPEARVYAAPIYASQRETPDSQGGIQMSIPGRFRSVFVEEAAGMRFD